VIGTDDASYRSADLANTIPFNFDSGENATYKYELWESDGSTPIALGQNN